MVISDRKIYTAIGLMSGTSLDGVDCALVETDGEGVVRPLDFVSIPYTPEDRAVVRPCFGVKDRGDQRVVAAERLLTMRHAEAVKALLSKTGRAASSVDVIGFHGQTIFHAPKDGVTIQIGDGALLAKETGIDVVADMRSADVRAGGEGAPLAPLYHWARVHSEGLPLPLAVLNIGGVANVTWVGAGADDILAFDTGPGNALMDDWVKTRTGALYDKDGAMAAKGTPVRAFLDQWFSHPYFTRVPPKSLDRDQWDVAGMGALSNEDGAATLMEFTVGAIEKSVAFMKEAPKTWYVCGGGRRNVAMMKALAARLPGDVRSVDELGWDGDATEAECFAYLAVRSLKGMVLSLPSTTGVPKGVTGGVLFRF